MTPERSSGLQNRQRPQPANPLSPEHYIRLLLRRKWLIVSIFGLVFAATVVVTYRMPNLYRSETLILVDPQKVPEAYVKSTVTGDVRNRLGTLSQQILSATRLQTIIDKLNLYPTERKTMAREELIGKMRKDISVNVVSDFGGSQDLQGFKIGYISRDPRQVAQVANELATLFIDENLKDREQQATGTNEFLQSQLQETRKALEIQEGKLKDFRMKHIGEMPEQQNADLQLLGQLKSQLQIESEGLARAEQQKAYLQSMMTQSAPVVDMDPETGSSAKEGEGGVKVPAQPGGPSKLAGFRSRLATLEGRYGDQHPEIRKLRQEIADEEAAEAAQRPTIATPVAAPSPKAPPSKRTVTVPIQSVNPVLQAQLKTAEDEIAKHKQEVQRLNKAAAGYQAKLEVIPIREQEISNLVRDYEISKAHYQHLLDNQLSAETATQLEIRQKGEKFKVLDSALPAERPWSPNRPLIDAGGAIAGLTLGILLALMTEFFGISITGPEQMVEATGFPLLEIIPVIKTESDRRIHKRRLLLAAVSSVIVIMLASGAAIFYHYRTLN